MSDPVLKLTCPRCGPDQVFLQADLAPGQALEDFRQTWRTYVSGVKSFYCPGCVGTYPAVSTVDPDGILELGDHTRPQVASIDVASGPAAGGTAIQLTGSGFTADEPTVLIGGDPATEVSVVSDTVLDCVTPAGDVGPADVCVHNTYGSCRESDKLVGAFEYTA